MGSLRWIVLNALAITIIHAAPRELSLEELITEPRPGEEYVNIQTTSQGKVDLQEQSFATSHRIPQKKATFETAHKVPPSDVKIRDVRTTLPDGEGIIAVEKIDAAESSHEPIYENANLSPVGEKSEVVTRTSIKMSKSKKVQKSVVKVPHEVQLDIKSDEGTIDETASADADVKEVMAKKHEKAEGEEGKAEPEVKPLRFNVPFEDEVAATGKPKLLSASVTTEAPPITTFNYKNVYAKVREIVKGEERHEVASTETIKTAESRGSSTAKKDTKQEKKSKLPKKGEEEHKKQDSGFYVLPVNKGSAQVGDDNFDFVDLDEKVLESAGSSPGQSSRINIKKGPNGQEYEYVYYYYYYDDDDDGKGNGTKDDKGERVYNGHDGPAVETYRDKDATKSSTSGSRYLPTESPKPAQKSRKKAQDDYDESDAAPDTSRSGSDNSRYASISRQAETVNEILPATSRPQPRSRGRTVGAQAVPADDIPPINEERLPANTRFPPRSRNSSPTTPPQPSQETTSRARSRESGSRLRLPNLGLLDSSSFRTHSSDASIDEDPIHDAELHHRRQPPPPPQPQPQSPSSSSRAYATESGDAITTLSHRRGRPTPSTTARAEEAVVEDGAVEGDVAAVSRRPAARRPVEERFLVPQEVVDEDEEDVGEEKVERIVGNGRRPETTRESDAEEGDFAGARGSTADVKASEVTTEDESAVGLTSAMMEKVALDLYAILQQAQDENIQTNFVDGNSTEITTEELITETTTLPTTTTTTELTTTTTTTTEPPTTTTTPPPTTVALGRGRYRTRAGGLSKGRPKAATTTTTTTEPPVETTSARTRGRFHPNANRAAGPGSRRIAKPKVEVAEEESVPKEEAPKQTVERAFGGRNRFRGGAKQAASTTTTTPAPSSVSGAAAIAGSRGSSVDRYNARRRGNRVSVSTTSQPPVEEGLEGERQEVQEGGGSHSTEETTAGASLKPGLRGRIHGGGARPLRPGPRVPLNLAQRGRVTSTTAVAPVEVEEPAAEKEVAEPEQPNPNGDEAQEAAAPPASDPLSRLKNRPRLRIGPGGPQQRQVPPAPGVAPPANRKKLVSSLLPKRRPGEEKPVEKPEEVPEERQEEEVYEDDVSPSSAEPTSTTEAETKGLTGLLNGRRRNLIRRPGTIYSRGQQAEAAA